MSYLSDWSFDPAVIAGIVLAALLYARGRRQLSVVRGTVRNSAWHAAAFYTGLAVIVVALESPIDTLGASLFTFHMIQHLLLIMVAPPLLLLGNPAVTMLRGVPLGVRRGVLGYAAHRKWVHALGRAASWIMSPVPALVIFIGTLYLWHWSLLFDLTLQNDSVHVFEHLCFLATALLFWSQVIDQRTIHAQLRYTRRALYTLFAAATSNILALFLVFAPRPLYAGYADLTSRPFGMTALGDQQIAGAIMWVPVLFIFGGAFAVFLYKALGEAEQDDGVLPAAPAAYRTVFTGSVDRSVHG